MHQIKRYKQ